MKKRAGVSQMVSNGMTLSQIGGALGHAVWDMGGTDEDTRSILDNRFLCDEIAALVLRRHIITVDRMFQSTYLGGGVKFLSPELENSGPINYTVRALEQWLSHCQTENVRTVGEAYEYLKSKNILERSLGCRDLEEIQRRGTGFLRENFKGDPVYAFKSSYQNFDHFYTPCLIDCRDHVGLVSYDFNFDGKGNNDFQRIPIPIWLFPEK